MSNEIDHEKTGFHVFLKKAPEVAKAFGGLIEALSAPGGLDAKTRELIYIGIRATQGEVQAVSTHVPRAKEAGATRDEIQNTILLTLTVCGITGISNCLVPALDAYDNN